MGRALIIAMALIAVGAIVLGLIAVGGPGTARLERQDNKRLEEIRRVTRLLACTREDAVLPETLDMGTLTNYCGGRAVAPDALTDPFSGTPYVYDRRSDTDFAICADFDIFGKQDGKADGRPGADLFMPPSYVQNFDAETGCMIGSIR